MNLKWNKKGNIFDPTGYKLTDECVEFAQSPQAVIFDDFVRVYFSTRKKEHNGKYLSFIAFADFDKGFTKVLRVSNETVIELGALGCFDEHGIFPISPLRTDGKLIAYTCGWSRRISVSVETSIGIAISHDNGKTFERIGDGPVMTSSPLEPMLVGDAFVRIYEGMYHMWYIFGQKWNESEGSEPPARIYKIAHAESRDGIIWQRDGREQIVTDKLNKHECQALPTVIKIGTRWHMYFCYREATDFRKNADRGYRIGYAYSDDLSNWTRDDENAGIGLSASGWDSDMMCYPHVFECDGKIYLLYNGNEFGRFGFGLAELSGAAELEKRFETRFNQI